MNRKDIVNLSANILTIIKSGIDIANIFGANISLARLWEIIKGALPTLEELIIICNAFNIKADDLLYKKIGTNYDNGQL